MTLPLIGITSARTLSSRGYPQLGVFEAYVTALSRAGASPVLIPLGLSETSMEGILPRLDGILFSGGGDVHPERYGSNPHPQVNFVDEDRDLVEIQLLQDVVKLKKPFFGICRGLQVINVALGGRLYEDLQDQCPNTLKHDYDLDKSRDFLAHSVKVGDSSILAGILGTDTIEVNSMHHQGIRDLAPDLQATAHAPDGLVEAIEIPGYPFGLAVQWHPEWQQGSLAMRALFRAFVEAVAQEDK